MVERFQHCHGTPSWFKAPKHFAKQNWTQLSTPCQNLHITSYLLTHRVENCLYSYWAEMRTLGRIQRRILGESVIYIQRRKTVQEQLTASEMKEPCNWNIYYSRTRKNCSNRFTTYIQECSQFPAKFVKNQKEANVLLKCLQFWELSQKQGFVLLNNLFDLDLWNGATKIM